MSVSWAKSASPQAYLLRGRMYYRGISKLFLYNRFEQLLFCGKLQNCKMDISMTLFWWISIRAVLSFFILFSTKIRYYHSFYFLNFLFSLCFLLVHAPWWKLSYLSSMVIPRSENLDGLFVLSDISLRRRTATCKSKTLTQ